MRSSRDYLVAIMVLIVGLIVGMTERFELSMGNAAAAGTRSRVRLRRIVVPKDVRSAMAEGRIRDVRRLVTEECSGDLLKRAQVFERLFFAADADTAYSSYLAGPELQTTEGCKAAGLFFLRQGAADRALAAFGSAAECETDLPSSEAAGGSRHLSYLDILDEIGLDGAAIDYCRSILESDPRNVTIRLRLIELLKKRESIDDVLAQFETLIELYPGNIRQYQVGIARELLRMDKHDAAIAYCRYVSADSDAVTQHLKRLDLYTELGLHSEARREVSSLSNLDPAGSREHRSQWLESCRRAYEEGIEARNDGRKAPQAFDAGLALLRHEPQFLGGNLGGLSSLASRAKRVSEDDSLASFVTLQAQHLVLYAAVSTPAGRKSPLNRLSELVSQPEARSAVDSLSEMLVNAIAHFRDAKVAMRVVETLFELKKFEQTIRAVEQMGDMDDLSRVSIHLLYSAALRRIGKTDEATRVREEAIATVGTYKAADCFDLSDLCCDHGMTEVAAMIWDRAAREAGADFGMLRQVYEFYEETRDAPYRADRLVEIAEKIVSSTDRSSWRGNQHFLLQELPLAYAEAGRCDDALRVFAELSRSEGISREEAGERELDRARLILRMMDAHIDCRTTAYMESVLVSLDRARPIIEQRQDGRLILWASPELKLIRLSEDGPSFGELIYERMHLHDATPNQVEHAVNTQDITNSQLQDALDEYEEQHRTLESTQLRGRWRGSSGTNSYLAAVRELAQNLYRGGDHTGGDAVVDRVVRSSNLSAGARSPGLILALDLSTKHDRWNKVAELCELLLSEKPRDGYVLETLAIAYEQQGRHRDCAQVYERMQQLRFGKRTSYLDSYHYMAWGKTYHRMGDDASAIAIWRRILLQPGSSAPGHQAFADGGYGAFLELLLSSGLPSEVLCYGEQALLLDPYNAGFHLHRIDILMSMGHTEEALKALVEMQRRLPVSHHLRQVKERTLGIYRTTNCRRFLESQADHAQGGWWANELGDFCLVRGKPEDALKWKRIAVDQTPENRLFKAALAFTFTEAGKYEEAARLHGNLIEEVEYTQSDLLYYLLQLANDRYLLGDLTQARAAWRVAAEVAPPGWESNFILGQALLNHGEITEARRYLEQALTVSSDSLHVLSDLMLACAADHDIEGVRNASLLLDSLGHPCWFADLLRRVPEHGREEFVETVELAMDSRSGSQHEHCDRAPPSLEDIRFAKLVNGLSLHEKLFDYLPHLSN